MSHSAIRFCTQTLACLTGFVLVSALVPNLASAAERPNIVFVLTDDQAPWAVGASGNEQAITPNMDRFFREGAYLKNTYVTTPVCSPSRASLMASRYGSELGVTDWINPRKEPELGLNPEVVTWPEVLHDAGYYTGLVGKWHLGVPDRFHPTRNGFDYFMGFREGGARTENPVLETNGEKQTFEGLTADILTNYAIQFLGRNKDRDPFLLCLHYRAPHTRYLPVADDDMAPYKDREMELPNPDYPKLDTTKAKRLMKEYLASVRSVDRNLGRLLKALDHHRLTQKTVVIFSSDHGYNMGHNGVWHKGNGHWILTEPPAATKNIPKGQRPNMFDNSLRVPAAVRWPGVIRPGAVIEQTVTFLDWYPTLVAIAGAKLPEGETIRGRDLGQLLRGNVPPDWDNDHYAEYSTHHQSQTQMRMYRTQRWKLVRDYLNPDRDELFDLADDPGESTNRIHDDKPEVREAIAKLDALLKAKLRETGDKVLTGID
jgi:choline-sulfatase